MIMMATTKTMITNGDGETTERGRAAIAETNHPDREVIFEFARFFNVFLHSIFFCPQVDLVPVTDVPAHETIKAGRACVLAHAQPQIPKSPNWFPRYDLDLRLTVPDGQNHAALQSHAIADHGRSATAAIHGANTNPIHRKHRLTDRTIGLDQIKTKDGTATRKMAKIQRARIGINAVKAVVYTNQLRNLEVVRDPHRNHKKSLGRHQMLQQNRTNHVRIRSTARNFNPPNGRSGAQHQRRNGTHSLNSKV